MEIAILIVNYNSSKELLEVAEQLENEVKFPKNSHKKIYILENGSTTPGQWEMLQVLKEYPDVQLFISEKNLGFAGGNNFLIEKTKESKPDYYLFLNPDTAVDRNFLIELLKPFNHLTMKQFNNVGLVSPKIYFYKGFETHPGRYKKGDFGKVIWYGGGIIDWDNVVGHHRSVDLVDKKTDQEVSTTDFCTGCCILAATRVIEKLGGFDEKYFLNLEDMDLSLRAQKAGFKTSFVPKAVVWHKNAVSKGGAGSEVEDFWQTRNRLIFAFRYAPLKTKILLFWRMVRTTDENRWKAIISAFQAIFY
jgi:GT2 family glycosyltransferase